MIKFPFTTEYGALLYLVAPRGHVHAKVLNMMPRTTSLNAAISLSEVIETWPHELSDSSPILDPSCPSVNIAQNQNQRRASAGQPLNDTAAKNDNKGS